VTSATCAATAAAAAAAARMRITARHFFYFSFCFERNAETKKALDKTAALVKKEAGKRTTRDAVRGFGSQTLRRIMMTCPAAPWRCVKSRRKNVKF
jgi:hypothetical protein